ncbi:chaperone protein DnaJ [Artemisia annua]|uniref:Chaperone protein DnaJ n=1 Tax=Artemisia annua TaxID=35608 RepID=A0A2U1LVJ4_ARTAN|nr:chaperone protein DnaJ [Artemisia annua]
MRMVLLKRCIHATGFRNSSEEDHYQILGVPYNASNDDIKKAFHVMAKKYHPDANENKTLAKIKFQEIRESYEILQDSERRAEYDKEQSSCSTCGGSGRVKVLKEVNVTIPAGIDTGDIISIPRAGSVGIRGKPRTLKLEMKVAKDPVFKREGSNLYVDSNISYSQAIMGGKVEVPTLSGNTEVEIPKGVKPGQVSILRGKGLPKKCFSMLRGDQYVRFCYDYTRTRKLRYF